MSFEDDMTKALQKKALGYNIDEVVEEYTSNEGELVLAKRKITTKYIAPDVAAFKTLQEILGKNISLEEYSDEELEKEKIQILEQLNQLEE